jgi:hypothetical protein
MSSGAARINNGTVPPTPAVGYTTIYVDSADKHVKQIDDTGLITDLTNTTPPTPPGDLTVKPSSGVIGTTNINVIRIDDQTIEVPVMSFYIDDTDSTHTLAAAQRITTYGDGLYDSGTGYIVITAFVAGDVDQTPSASNDFIGKKVVGTSITLFWYRLIPLERGYLLPPDLRSGVTLTRIYYIGSSLKLGDRPWHISDRKTASLDILLASPGYFHEVVYSSGTIFNMTRDAVAIRRGGAAIGHSSLVTPQTNDIFLGLHYEPTKAFRGVPIRFHLKNLTDDTGSSDGYIENSEVIAGGAYAQWWRYIDQTADVTPSDSLTPTLVASATDWVYITFGYFAGSGNVIGIWGTKSIGTANVDAAVSEPSLSLSDRTRDLTMLFTLLVQCTASTTITNYKILPAPKMVTTQ